MQSELLKRNILSVLTPEGTWTEQRRAEVLDIMTKNVFGALALGKNRVIYRRFGQTLHPCTVQRLMRRGGRFIAHFYRLPLDVFCNSCAVMPMSARTSYTGGTPVLRGRQVLPPLFGVMSVSRVLCSLPLLFNS
jgi:hypothetical protein